MYLVHIDALTLLLVHSLTAEPGGGGLKSECPEKSKIERQISKF